MHPLLGALELSYHRSLREIPPDDWDSLAAGASLLLRYRWLAGLETSGSVGPAADWQPYHLTVHYKQRLVAAAPLYLRGGSSQGEFVFDQPWAGAAEQLSIPYFPKLVGMSPLTPIPAFDILIDAAWCDEQGLDPAELRRWLLSRICLQAQREGIAGVHLQFVQPELRAAAADSGFIQWKHAGFRWENHGYRSWDDFLGTMSKNRRRNARRERRKLREAGIQVRMLSASEIPDAWFELMYRYYRDTTDQFGPWAAQFLNREFFLDLREAAGDALLFSAAFRDGQAEPVALAMLLTDGYELLGRYWGTSVDIPYLHFECCYYTPIEWAIEHGIQRFNPGMGGEHKIHRGFAGAADSSMHWFSDPRMRMLFHGNIHQFNDLTAEILAETAELSPLLPRGTENE